MEPVRDPAAYRLGVHETHCCARHGCKYGDSDCPVPGEVAQRYRCEQCDNELEELGDLPWQMNGLYEAGRRSMMRDLGYGEMG
jgi:hypothetical protein